MKSIDHSELLATVAYDPETGVFTKIGGYNKRWRDGAPLGSLCHDGRVRLRVQDKQVLAHRLAWFYMTGEWPHDTIDHIDRDPSNNAWANLRMATRAEQAMNRGAICRKRRKAPVGVFWNKANKNWRSMIKKGGVTQSLGSFNCIGQAYAAYRTAKSQLHVISSYARENSHLCSESS